MFIRAPLKEITCVILTVLLFEAANANYKNQQIRPTYVELVLPILKRLSLPNLLPDPSSNGTPAYTPKPPTPPTDKCPPQTDCEEDKHKKKDVMYDRMNQIDDDDDPQSYSYNNKRQVKVTRLDKKILDILYNMELFETDNNQEMVNQKFIK